MGFGPFSRAERIPLEIWGSKEKPGKCFKDDVLRKVYLIILRRRPRIIEEKGGEVFLSLSLRMILIRNDLAELDIGISKSVISPEGNEIVIPNSLAVGRNRIIFRHIARRCIVIIYNDRKFRTDLGGVSKT